jgi:Domain of unknown function (DUF1707)
MSLTSRSGELRIGDAEREAAVSVLGDHYAAGRITQAEFDQRTSLAYAARTNADLWPLFRDLPEIGPGAGGAVRRKNRAVTAVPAPATDPRGHRPSLATIAPLLLVVLALAVLPHLHVPWPILLIVGWLWWSRMFRHRSRYSNGSRRCVRGSWS